MSFSLLSNLFDFLALLVGRQNEGRVRSTLLLHETNEDASRHKWRSKRRRLCNIWEFWLNAIVCNIRIEILQNREMCTCSRLKGFFVSFTLIWEESKNKPLVSALIQETTMYILPVIPFLFLFSYLLKSGFNYYLALLIAIVGITIGTLLMKKFY